MHTWVKWCLVISAAGCGEYIAISWLISEIKESTAKISSQLDTLYAFGRHQFEQNSYKFARIEKTSVFIESFVGQLMKENSLHSQVNARGPMNPPEDEEDDASAFRHVATPTSRELDEMFPDAGDPNGIQKSS